MNNQKKIIYNRNYRKTHKEQCRVYAKKYWITHKEEYDKYYNKNKEKIVNRKHKWYLQNKSRHNKQTQKNYEKNKVKILEKQKRYIQNKRKTDINFKLRDNLRHRIYLVLKENQKSLSTEKLIGCSIQQLKKYLEGQFKRGMSWNNYGKWHTDHIKPCTSFDLSKASEQRKCFYYKNLQPLWAKDNLKKYNKEIKK